MSILVLLRHGESLWNRENRFTGWTDVDLTERGKTQAREAGSRLRDAGLEPDVTYTSYLRRAIRTLWLALEAMDRMWLPVHRSWRLNERHYGALQALYKGEVARRVGDAQVQRWRRGFRERPPALDPSDPRYPGHALRYRALPPGDLPLTESLEDTLRRVLPYWNEEIAAALARDKTVLLSAHQNSLRALLYVLDAHTPETIESIEVPMGVPLVYRLDENLRPSHCELLAPSGDPSPLAALGATHLS